MDAGQKRKLVGWCAFYVTLPLLVYPAAALAAYFLGIPFALADVLVKGDLLFLVVILLATTLDWTVIDFLLTPKRQADLQWSNYAWFCATLLALLFYTLVYGWLLTSRIPGSPAIRNPEAVMWFSGLSVVMTIWYCGYRYFHLLLLGRI